MEKINFQDLPNTDTPIKASTLNTMQSNIEESCVAVSPTQPETNERVWIQKTDTDKKIWCKNDNGVFEKVYDESEMNKTNYSTNEQVIGTWIDGKPLYRKVIQSKTSTSINTEEITIFADYVKNIISVNGYLDFGDGIGTKFPLNIYFESDYIVKTYWDAPSGVGRIRNIVTNSKITDKDIIFIIEYTKTTD